MVAQPILLWLAGIGGAIIIADLALDVIVGLVVAWELTVSRPLVLAVIALGMVAGLVAMRSKLGAA